MGSKMVRPGGTPDLLVRRGKTRYTPTHAVQQEPIESAQNGNSSRTVLDGVVHRSRTITRTISARCTAPFIAASNETSVAEEKLPTKMLVSAWIAFCSVALSVSGGQHFVFGPFSAAVTHTSTVTCRPVGFLTSRKSSPSTRKHVALKCSIAQFWCSLSALPSDSIPDVPLQSLASARLPRECPSFVRESNAH